MQKGFLSSGGGRGNHKKKDCSRSDASQPASSQEGQDVSDNGKGFTSTVVDMGVEKEKLSSLEDTTVLGSFLPLPTQVTTSANNAPGKSSYANVIAFSEDGLSVIAIKLCTPLMLGSYTSDMCMQSWGAGENKTVKKPSQTSRGVPVGPKMGFKSQKEYRLVTKKLTTNSSGNKKKGMEPTIKVSNSNPFDVLNSVDNDGEFGTNGGLIICKDGSDKGYDTNSLLEQWRDSYPDNDDYDPYDDDMYENHDLSEHLQSICDDLDITVRVLYQGSQLQLVVYLLRLLGQSIFGWVDALAYEKARKEEEAMVVFAEMLDAGVRSMPKKNLRTYCLMRFQYLDDEGNNDFHIAADMAKMIHENLEGSIVMLKYPGATVEDAAAKAEVVEERGCTVNERLSQTLSRINILEAHVLLLSYRQLVTCANCRKLTVSCVADIKIEI
nr:ankyrin repeat-containing protein [Tanacetum cinerariifolium]